MGTVRYVVVSDMQMLVSYQLAPPGKDSTPEGWTRTTDAENGGVTAAYLLGCEHPLTFYTAVGAQMVIDRFRIPDAKPSRWVVGS